MIAGKEMVRAKVRFGRVPEGLDERMTLEFRLHDAALDPAASAVDQSNLPKAGRVSLVDVLVDDRPHVRRCERVEVEARFDGEAERVCVHVSKQ